MHFPPREGHEPTRALARVKRVSQLGSRVSNRPRLPRRDRSVRVSESRRVRSARAGVVVMRSLALQRDVEVWKMKIHAEEFTGKRRRFRDVRHPEPLQRFAHLELHRRHAHFFLLREPELFGASFEARFEIRHGIFVAEETRVHARCAWYPTRITSSD